MHQKTDKNGRALTCAPAKDGWALIVAGGGSWGALATGILKTLNKNYQVAAGISTGNLIAPIALQGHYDALIEAYSSVNLKRIFSVSPFTKKGKVRLLHALYRLSTRKGSLGEMHRLKKLIREFYPPIDHLNNRREGKIGLCGALNISRSPHKMDLFRTDTSNYEEFTAAMYASCCFWPVAEVARINDCHYVDGGYVETLLIDEIIALGYRNIDVITLRPRHKETHSLYSTKKFLETGKRILSAIRYDTVYENLNKACIEAAARKDVTINVYHAPRKLSENSMAFNQKEMREWVALGQELATDLRYIDTY